MVEKTEQNTSVKAGGNASCLIFQKTVLFISNNTGNLISVSSGMLSLAFYETYMEWLKNYKLFQKERETEYNKMEIGNMEN
jgi:hypothetical protein